MRLLWRESNSRLHRVRLGKPSGGFDIFLDVLLEVVDGFLDGDLVVSVDDDVDGLGDIGGEAGPSLPLGDGQFFSFADLQGCLV